MGPWVVTPVSIGIDGTPAASTLDFNGNPVLFVVQPSAMKAAIQDLNGKPFFTVFLDNRWKTTFYPLTLGHY